MNRRTFLKSLGMASACALSRSAAAAPRPRNVLLICVDDLRPVLACYGGAAKTPNLDHFAETGTVFLNHYVQWPVCGPSRATLLGGVRPGTSGIYGNGEAGKIADRPGDRPTMPLYFKNHGYHTTGLGKIYHGKGASPGSGWSETPWKPDWTCYVNFPVENYKDGDWRPVYEIYDGPDSKHNDYQTADRALAALESLKDGPFFLATGFYKPHLPFVAPKRYWDLYSDGEVELLEPRTRAEGAADYMYNWGETDAYGITPGELFSREIRPTDKEARDMTHAYYACVSFTDAQIGRLLDKLDALGLAEDTAVVIWGDHGFHLGDQGRWAKHTQFEGAMRSLLLVRLPGVQKAGVRTHAIVETVDIYPSLCAYCGIETPPHLEGESFLGVVSGDAPEGKAAAYGEISPVGGPNKEYMAYTVRTERFRFVQWRDRADGQRVVSEELYDYQLGPAETLNLVSNPEYASAVARHRALILEGFPQIHP